MTIKELQSFKMTRELFSDIVNDAGQSLDEDDYNDVLLAVASNDEFLVNADTMDQYDKTCRCPLVAAGIGRADFDGSHYAFMEVYDEQIAHYLELDDQPAIIEVT